MIGVTRAAAGPMVEYERKLSVQGRAGPVQFKISGQVLVLGQVVVYFRSPAVPGCFEKGMNVTSSKELAQGVRCLMWQTLNRRGGFPLSGSWRAQISPLQGFRSFDSIGRDFDRGSHPSRIPRWTRFPTNRQMTSQHEQGTKRDGSRKKSCRRSGTVRVVAGKKGVALLKEAIDAAKLHSSRGTTESAESL